MTSNTGAAGKQGTEQSYITPGAIPRPPEGSLALAAKALSIIKPDELY
jgi:hypothetical protein